MWQVENDGKNVVFDNIEVLLLPAKFGKGFPVGEAKKTARGYVFYYMENGEEEFITVQISDEPICTSIIAVTEAQLKVWKNWKIIAKPAVFIWK